MAINYPTSLDTFTNPTATSLLTSPSHSGLHSDINDAVEALEYKVGIGNTQLGAYTTYTPTWTNLTVGDGTLSARYCRVNNLVHVTGYLIFGSTTAITATGVNMSLPVNAGGTFLAIAGAPASAFIYFDTSAATYFYGAGNSLASATQIILRVNRSDTAYLQHNSLTSAIPMTWATGDRIFWNFMYEAA